MNDFAGNYLLIEFSASWCKWCKDEIPFLKEAYKRYADDGLNTITMNLDTDREKWAKEVRSEDLPWQTLSDLEAFKGDLTANYAVSAIPRIFLISPEGVIVANNLRKQSILDKLEDIYSK